MSVLDTLWATDTTAALDGAAPTRMGESQRARLLAAAVQVVSELGYRGMSTARVNGRAGVSRKAFYDLLKDRNDCLRVPFEPALALAPGGRARPSRPRRGGWIGYRRACWRCLSSSIRSPRSHGIAWSPQPTRDRLWWRLAARCVIASPGPAWSAVVCPALGVRRAKPVTDAEPRSWLKPRRARLPARLPVPRRGMPRRVSSNERGQGAAKGYACHPEAQGRGITHLHRSGHLMPGAEDEAAGLMDSYLQAARASAS